MCLAIEATPGDQTRLPTAGHMVADSGASGGRHTVTSHLEAAPGDQTRYLMTGHLVADGGAGNIQYVQQKQRNGESQTIYPTTEHASDFALLVNTPY